MRVFTAFTEADLFKNLVMHPGFPASGPDAVFKSSLFSVRVIDHHRRGFAGQHTEKQRLLHAVQAAALVQSTLVHRCVGFTSTSTKLLPPSCSVSRSDRRLLAKSLLL